MPYKNEKIDRLLADSFLKRSLLGTSIFAVNIEQPAFERRTIENLLNWVKTDPVYARRYMSILETYYGIPEESQALYLLENEFNWAKDSAKQFYRNWEKMRKNARKTEDEQESNYRYRKLERDIIDSIDRFLIRKLDMEDLKKTKANYNLKSDNQAKGFMFFLYMIRYVTFMPWDLSAVINDVMKLYDLSGSEVNEILDKVKANTI